MTGLSTTTKTILLFVMAVILMGAGFLLIDWQDRQVGVLRVDAGPKEGETYFLMSEFAEVIERNSEILRLEVVASEPFQEGHEQLLREGIDLTTIQSHTPSIPDTQLIVGLYEEVFQLITRADSNIYFVDDLQRKRLALPPHGSAELSFFWAIGDHYNLFVQNVNWVSMSEFEAVNALLNDEVDAIFFVGSERNHATLKLIEEFELKKDAPKLRMIEIDQAAAMGVKRPYIETFELEKGTFDGSPPLPHRGMVTAAVRRSLIARSSADEELVTELTRVLFENRADLTVRFPLASQIQAPDRAAGLKLPLHPGAERYYSRNEPSFIQENAEPLALMVTVFAMLTSGLLTLRKRYTASQKNKADRFNYDVLNIGKEVESAESEEQLIKCRKRLQDLLDKAVVALDVDEVSDAGFQSFAFLWKTVSTNLDERLEADKVKSRSVALKSAAAE